MAWRDELLPASFRGVEFKVAGNTTTGGRRGVTFEFPKQDTPADEDLGRRATRRLVSGYVIGPDYHRQADQLEAVLNREGGGYLSLPILAGLTCRCENYARSERREEGGFAVFEMSFVEAPASATGGVTKTDDTQSKVDDKASALSDAADLSAGNDSNWVS